MVPERSHLGWGLPRLPDDFWRQPGDKDEDLPLAQDSSLSRLVAQRRKLRMMAQGAALEEIANSRLRRLLAYNKSFVRTDLKIASSALPYTAQRKKGGPRWRGPALISDVDETGAAAKFQSQTQKVARFCVRERVEAGDVGDAGLDLYA